MRHCLPILVLSGLLLAFGLRSADLHASIDVTLVRPSAGAVSDTALWIVATVSSTYQLESVVATVAARQVSLTFVPTAYCDRFCHPGWTGTLSLAGLPRGPQTITVVATDALAGTGQAQGTFVYDQPPQQVIGPLEETVARPDLHVTLACTDDDPAGCASVNVSVVNGPVLATGVSSLDATVSLSAYEGQSVILRFASADSTGRQTAENRLFYVESSPWLTEVATVGGSILDVRADRILYRQGDHVAIRTLSSGVDTLLDPPVSPDPGHGFLTPRGAIAHSTNMALYEWRDGSVVDHGTYPSDLQVEGDFAIWDQWSEVELIHFLNAYDLRAGAKSLVATNGSVNFPGFGFGNGANSVAPDGDVAYARAVASPTPYYGYDFHVFLWHAGTSTQLTSTEGIWDSQPVFDGINVVFARRPCCTNSGPWSSVLHDGSQELVLDPSHGSDAGNSYRVVNGWTAFTRRAPDGTLQAWLRSPTGDLTQRSFFGTSSQLGSLTGNGGLTFSNGGRLYLALPGLAARDVASSLGYSFWLAGTAYVRLGRSLFRIEGSGISGPLRFYTVTPCRILDTRNADGPFGGPALAGMSRRVFDVAGSCEIPASASSVSANVTVTSAESPGHLRLSPAAGLAPSTSTINFAPGQTRANNAILSLDGAGQVAVQNGGAGNVHVILDVNGWFE